MEKGRVYISDLAGIITELLESVESGIASPIRMKKFYITDGPFIETKEHLAACYSSDEEGQRRLQVRR